MIHSFMQFFPTGFSHEAGRVSTASEQADQSRTGGHSVQPDYEGNGHERTQGNTEAVVVEGVGYPEFPPLGENAWKVASRSRASHGGPGNPHRRDEGEYRSRYINQKKAIESLEAQLQEKDQEIARWRDSDGILKERLKAMEAESKRKDTRVDQLSQLLELRTTELQGAQKFLTTEDEMSVAEVIRMVESLNEDIFQTAAVITDSSEFRRATIDVESAAFLHQKFGNDFVQAILSSRGREDSDGIIQTAIQHHLVMYCLHATVGWLRYPEVGANRLLDHIWERIQTIASPGAAKRWRVMTRASAKHVGADKLDEQTYTQMMDPLARTISGILICAGVGGTPQDVTATVMAKFSGRLVDIEKSRAKLDCALGERVTSVGLELFALHAGAVFSSTDMDEAHSEVGKPQEGDRVAFTTYIGLRQVSKDGSNMLLKPKGVRLSALSST